MTRPAPACEPPDGMHWEATVDEGWITPPIGAGRCRYISGEHGRKACGRPAIATLMRGTSQRRRPWDYCADHLYGRWIENGHVVGWRFVKDDQ